MLEVDVTRLIDDVDPFDLSASKAERGENAGPETWANAKAEASSNPVLKPDERDDAISFFKGFGAWTVEEMNAWSAEELDALVLQFAAGDLRELQSVCPGDGLGDIDWDQAEAFISEGTVSGRVFASGDKLFLSLD